MFPFGFGLSYTKFGFSDLHVQSSSAGGVVQTSASRPRSPTPGRWPVPTSPRSISAIRRVAGEPPRQLVGFRKVDLQPGKSARVEFTVTPRDTWWWAQTAGGWTQSPGDYRVYVGDSSALANLPLRGSFAITQTAAARQVIVDAPREFVPGQSGQVTVRLTRSGSATLPLVRLALQLPQGWTATPIGPTTFTQVGPTAVAAGVVHGHAALMGAGDQRHHPCDGRPRP